MCNKLNQSGLSMVGMLIVVVLLGVVAATVVPVMLSKYNQSVTGSDRQALESAKAAIISYALSSGKLPRPVDANNNPVTGSSGLMPPSAGTGAGVISQLGVNNWGVFGKESPFHLDVNDALLLTNTAVNTCRNAQSALQSPGPSICQDVGTAASCSTTPIPMAFVLYSTGSDHVANLKNAGTNRVYESENRGIDNNPGPNHYDDIVLSYPLSSLLTACTPREEEEAHRHKSLEIHNSHSHRIWYDIEHDGSPCNPAHLVSIEANQALPVTGSPTDRIWESKDESADHCSGDIENGRTLTEITGGSDAVICSVTDDKSGHAAESCH